MMEPRASADLPRTIPRVVDRRDDPDLESRAPTFLVPVGLAFLLLLGIVYFFYGSTPMQGPNVRADAAAQSGMNRI